MNINLLNNKVIYLNNFVIYLNASILYFLISVYSSLNTFLLFDNLIIITYTYFLVISSTNSEIRAELN